MFVFSDSSVTSARAASERRLFLAVLEDAIRLVRKGIDGPAFTARHAQADLDWIFSEDRTWPCSFLNVCGFLGLDAEWIRRQVVSDLRGSGLVNWRSALRSSRPSKLHLV